MTPIMCSIELRQCWHANDAHRCCCSRFRERILLFSASSGRSRERNFAASSVSCCRVDCLQPVAKPPEISLVGLFFLHKKSNKSTGNGQSTFYYKAPSDTVQVYLYNYIIFLCVHYAGMLMRIQLPIMQLSNKVNLPDKDEFFILLFSFYFNQVLVHV